MYHNRLRWLLAALLLPLALWACSADDLSELIPSTYTLTLNGTGYAPHTDQTLRFSLIDAGTSLEVDRQSTVVAVDGTFTVTFTDAMIEGYTYQVDYFADGGTSGNDSAENGLCDSGSDHAWRLGIAGTGATINGTPAAVTGDVTGAVAHSGANQTDTCATFAGLPAPYDFTFVANGYTGPHANQSMGMAIVKTTTGTVVATQTQTLPASGTASVTYTFTGALVDGNTYQFDSYVDGGVGGAGNGVCDAPPTDHQWRVAITDVDADGANDVTINGSATAVGNAITLTNSHSTAFTDVCASFP